MEMFQVISIIFLVFGFLSAIVVLLQFRSQKQSMKIMYPVWVLTALWAGLTGLWAYFSFGKPSGKMDMGNMPMKDMPMDHMKMPETAFWKKVSLSTLHCGAGCTLADVIGEWTGYHFRFLAMDNGLIWQWSFDYILALIIGVLFQYAAIRPMQHLPVGATLKKAFKIDFLSLTSWQIGMYAFSYLLLYVVMPSPLPQNTPGFWFVMQLAMCCGFLFSYPINWWLIKKGIKPSM